MDTKSKRGLYGKIAIFALAVPASCAQLAAPVASSMMVDFPDMTLTTVGLITSLPPLAMIITLFIGSWLTTKVERKAIITFALILTIFGGIGPALPFITSSFQVLALRFMMGIGIGLIGSLPATYIAEYAMEERGKLVGILQFVGSAGGAAIIALVAPVSKFGWKAVLMIHLILVVAIVTTLTGLSSTGPLKAVTKNDDADEKKEKIKLPVEYFTGIITAFLMMVVYIGATSYLTNYVTEVGAGGQALSGTTLSVARLVGAFGSLLVPVLSKYLKSWLGVFASALIVIAALIYTIPTATTIVIGYCLIYFSSVIASVACTIRNTTMLPLQRVAFGQAALTTILYLGQFVSTAVVIKIADVLDVSVINKEVIYCILIPIILMAFVSIPRKRKIT